MTNQEFDILVDPIRPILRKHGFSFCDWCLLKHDKRIAIMKTMDQLDAIAVINVMATLQAEDLINFGMEHSSPRFEKTIQTLEKIKDELLMNDCLSKFKDPDDAQAEFDRIKEGRPSKIDILLD